MNSYCREEFWYSPAGPSKEFNPDRGSTFLYDLG